ncbi:MAG: response regulator [Kofleriaceae bacterium]
MERRKLLLVDDDARIAKLIIRAFGRAGFEVQAVGDIADLRAVVEQFAPDAILLDENLPSSRGTELVSQARRDGVLRTNVVVIGWSGDDPPAHYRELGFDDFIAKPFDLATLVTLVEDLLAQARP